MSVRPLPGEGTLKKGCVTTLEILGVLHMIFCDFVNIHMFYDVLQKHKHNRQLLLKVVNEIHVEEGINQSKQDVGLNNGQITDGGAELSLPFNTGYSSMLYVDELLIQDALSKIHDLSSKLIFVDRRWMRIWVYPSVPANSQPWTSRCGDRYDPQLVKRSSE